jgi:Ca2+-binding RTX toxin-like protein
MTRRFVPGELLEDRAMLAGDGSALFINFVTGEPFAIDEGQGLSMQIWVESQGMPGTPIDVDVDLNNDEIPDKSGSVTGSPEFGPAADVLTISFTWTELVNLGIDDGLVPAYLSEYPITVTATEGDGDFATELTAVQVSNLAPVISSLTATTSGGGGCNGGSDITIAATILEPGPLTGELDELTAEIEWAPGVTNLVSLIMVGPGEYAINPSDLGATHTYAASGPHSITLTVTESDSLDFDQESVVGNTGGGGGPSVCLSGGVLTVTGSGGNDIVTVSQASGQIQVLSSFYAATQFANADVDSVLVQLGAGNDALVVTAHKPVVAVGGDGIDVLTGGPGKDILIGGNGTDMLLGGGGQDLLLDGCSTYDANATALLFMLAEWNSANSFQDRVLNLMNGTGSVQGLNETQSGSYFLLPAANDNAIDILVGGASLDWLLLHLGDLVIGNNDTLTNL